MLWLYVRWLFFFFFVDSLLLTYVTLVRYKLECAVPVWHNTTAAVTNKLEHVERKFAIYIPVSRPTDATCDRFLFSIYMCITLHDSSVKRSSSGVPHRTYSLQFVEHFTFNALVQNTQVTTLLYFCGNNYKKNLKCQMYLHLSSHSP
jgi:hypothetical protein